MRLWLFADAETGENFFQHVGIGAFADDFAESNERFAQKGVKVLPAAN